MTPYTKTLENLCDMQGKIIELLIECRFDISKIDKKEVQKLHKKYLKLKQPK